MDTTQSQSTDRGTADTPVAQRGAPHSCCGGPAPSGTSGCCALDAEVKSAGGRMRVRIGLGHTGAEEVGVLRVTPSLVSVSAGCDRSRSPFSGQAARIQTAQVRRPLYRRLIRISQYSKRSRETNNVARKSSSSPERAVDWGRPRHDTCAPACTRRGRLTSLGSVSRIRDGDVTTL